MGGLLSTSWLEILDLYLLQFYVLDYYDRLYYGVPREVRALEHVVEHSKEGISGLWRSPGGVLKPRDRR
jgi:hypothetical protein